MSARSADRPDNRPADRPKRGDEDPGPLWPFLLIAVALLAAFAIFHEPDEQAPPPEPVDPTTRAACRAWHVVMAATGVESLDAPTRYERTLLVEDFMERAETVALTRNADQETYLAVVDSIEAAREVRDARGASDVYWALDAFDASLTAVDATCEQD